MNGGLSPRQGVGEAWQTRKSLPLPPTPLTPYQMSDQLAAMTERWSGALLQNSKALIAELQRYVTFGVWRLASGVALPALAVKKILFSIILYYYKSSFRLAGYNTRNWPCSQSMHENALIDRASNVSGVGGLFPASTVHTRDQHAAVLLR